MRILVTAGNTQAPIDKVRCLTNIFTGRTGATIALDARQRGHQVTLLTSHSESVWDLGRGRTPPASRGWVVQTYRTFDELQTQLAGQIGTNAFDTVIHAAAVSDYLAAGVFACAPHTRFEPDGKWRSDSSAPPALEVRAAAKIKSDEPELWIRLQRAPKLIDRFRSDWGFRGVLVKFKLEVDISDESLLEVAERSRRLSDADLMVANSLEGAAAWGFVGPVNGHYQRVERPALAARLLDEVERLHEESRRG